MRSLVLSVCFSLLLHSTSGYVEGSTEEVLQAFCASDGHQNSNYCLTQSLSGTYIVRCRNGKSYFSDCAADLECTNRVTDRDSSFNCYEGTDPDPNGDGRAQCAVGSDLPDVTVYADDGSVYKVGSNEVSTPSPDYQGKGFFNDTFYPLGGSGSPGGGGPDVGPAYFDFCGTGPAPNVNENDSEASMTGTNTPIPSSKSDNNSVSSEISTSTASVRSSSPTVPFPTDTRTGDHSHTSGILPTGSGYHTPSISTPVPFTGDASSQKGRLGFFAFLSGISMMVVF